MEHIMWPILCLCSFFILINCDCTVDEPSETEAEKKFLEAIAPLQGIVFEAKDGNFSYKVSLCSQISNENKYAGAIQFTYNPNKTHVLGRYDKCDVIGGENWIFLTYYGGEPYPNHCGKANRTSLIMITCDKQATGNKGSLRIVSERKSSDSSNCHYLFELASNVSCTAQPNPPKEKLSSGSIFCILFFTAAIVYIVCGFLYQRVVVGAKGMEQIPNYSFWTNFGNLQADGCDFCCRWGQRHNSQAYRGIDDQFTQEDRDDQLLN